MLVNTWLVFINYGAISVPDFLFYAICFAGQDHNAVN